jgi:hypothetical protein
MEVNNIGILRDRIRSYRSRQVRPTEADTIRVLILPLLRSLGWNIDDIDEVRSEYRHTPGDNPVDCALFLQRTPVLFVEAKALGIPLDDRKWLTQTLNYANNAGVDWCVLTNGDEYRIYKVHAQVEAEEKLFFKVSIDSDENPESRDKFLALISRDRMQHRAIDALWTEWRVDSQIRRILENLPSDEAFIRFLSKKSDGLKPSDIRASLLRSAFRMEYPDARELIRAPNRTPWDVSLEAADALQIRRPQMRDRSPDFDHQDQSPGSGSSKSNRGVCPGTSFFTSVGVELATPLTCGFLQKTDPSRTKVCPRTR